MRRCRRKELPTFAALGVAVASLIAGCEGGPSVVGTCATLDGAYLSSHQLGDGLQVIVDQRFTASPAAAHRSLNGTPPPQISQWVSGKLIGWIAITAVDGPARASEDALARSLGYTVGKWPLVPLSGAVVEHNPGVLEVYQTNDVFASSAAAEDYFSGLSQSAIGSETITITEGGRTKPRAEPLKLSGGDLSFGDQTPGWIDPTSGMTETFVSLGVLLGDAVVQLSVQGGSDVGPNQALALLNQALSRVASTCRIATPTITGS
jgi:hypothetical protein